MGGKGGEGGGGGDDDGDDGGGGDALAFCFCCFCCFCCCRGAFGFGLRSSHQSSAIVPPSSQCTSCRRKDQPSPPFLFGVPEAEGRGEEEGRGSEGEEELLPAPAPESRLRSLSAGSRAPP